MEELIVKYSKFLKDRRGLSNNTVDSYRRDLENHYKFLDGNNIKHVADVDEKVINQYIKMLKDNNFALRTISRKISTLNIFYKYLMDKGIIKTNPMQNVKSVKVKKQKYEPVSKVWVDFLINLPNINGCTGLRDRLVFEIIYGCGMRISELANLKVEDIDFMTHSIACGNENRRRVVPMYKKLEDTILRYIKIERPRLARDKKDGFLLINKNGTGFTRQGLWKLMRAYLDKIPSSEGMTPDKLRQSLAVHLFENGVERTDIQKFMGYKNIYSINGYAAAVSRNKRYVLKIKNKKTISAQDLAAHPRSSE